MSILESLLTNLQDLVPVTLTIVGVIAVMIAARWIINRRFAGYPGRSFRRQWILLALSFIGLLVVILALPISEGTKGQLLSLLGLLLSAAIALSATTFVGNMMAGLMLRAVRNFRPGDFVRVGEHFGRVSEMGLFHVEIQTEDRDLTTMPNLYLVTNPVKVVRSSGTLIIADVSLGYDVSRLEITEALLHAAEDVGLEDPFVHIMELGDYSVRYRLAGLLSEVKSLLTTRSRLRECMLDRLHERGIEIVSPTFMNQRPLPLDRKFIPSIVRPSAPAPADAPVPEAVVFDKADEAESLERLQEKHRQLLEEIEEAGKLAHEGADEVEKENRRRELDTLRNRADRLAKYIAHRQEREKD